jgi:homospermidine synthase
MQQDDPDRAHLSPHGVAFSEGRKLAPKNYAAPTLVKSAVLSAIAASVEPVVSGAPLG